MMRITKKLNEPYVIDNNTIMYYVDSSMSVINSSGLNMVNKLGKLEDIEEQLECPLEAREQALKQGYIYTAWHSRDGFEKQEITHLVYDKDIKMWIFKDLEKNTEGFYCELANIPVDGYKKTWWLREDGSE